MTRTKSNLTFLLGALTGAACLTGCFSTSETEELRGKPGMGLAELSDNHCSSMQDWIAQDRSRLPTTYDEFLRYPAECRRLLYIELPPAMQSVLWRTQIERYRARHPDLTSEQLAVLDRALELLSPASFAIPQDSPQWKRFMASVEALTEESLRVFGEHETGILFAQLGPGDKKSVDAQFGGTFVVH